MTEMAEMGIGNKPCLDIRPSQDQINDRSISYAQLAKGKFCCILYYYFFLVQDTSIHRSSSCLKK